MSIIAISRGSLRGGRAVAELLSERLDYPVIGREEALCEAARDYGISEDDLKKALNGVPYFWQQVPGKRLVYAKCMTVAILAHVKHGNLIYHGIAGHLHLSSISEVLRVRVIADMQYRIEALMKESNLNKEEAIAHIQHVDRDRSQWARLLYGVEWEDPGLYDLILNLGRISVECACETIIRISEQKEFEYTPESQKHLEDFSLSCRVWAALAKHPKTRSAGVHVNADNGDVVVGGTVNSVKALELIPQIVESVEGVKSFRCEAGVGTGWYW